MTNAVFVSPDGTRFKVEGASHSCALYVYDESSMSYNRLENINAAGQARIERGIEIATRYADCSSGDFSFERHR